MQFRLNLTNESPKAWIDAVMSDFNSFLIDHANCERKASAMAMSFVAKYPNRTEIIPELIDTAVEELEHFRQVYQLLEKRGVQLAHEITQDHYIKQLLDFCRSGKEERFLDRLLMASVVETRGAERFRLVYQAVQESDLKKFYHDLWASEARHGEIFVRMALNYFDQDSVFERIKLFNDYEGSIIENLPIKAALH